MMFFLFILDACNTNPCTGANTRCVQTSTGLGYTCECATTGYTTLSGSGNTLICRGNNIDN